MRKHRVVWIAALLWIAPIFGQEAAAPNAKPTEHVLGTVTAVDQAQHTITVKDDKSASEQKIQVGNTKTLLKVPPGAKDLKSATRITADDLAVGDRVDVRGFKAEDDPSVINARSVVLMSARDLQQAHQAQAAAWAHSTAGRVTAVDPATGTITIAVRSLSNPAGANAPVVMTVNTTKQTEFTRYSPQNPQAPVPSQLSDIQKGDQVRVIGSKNNDLSAIAAEKVYSGAFRTLDGIILSIAPDGKSLTVRDLATKKPAEIALTANSAVRKLPPAMAMMLARRLNPSFRGNSAGQAGGEANSENRGQTAGAPPAGAKAGESGPPPAAPTGARPAWQGRPGAAGGGNWNGAEGGGGNRTSGDISQMIASLPQISITELKPGDAVVISGVATNGDSSQLTASNVIAGVEPVLQSAPSRQGSQSAGGDWGLGEMQIPQ